MINKILLFTLALFTTSSFFSDIYSQSYNENDKDGLRAFLRQQSANTNITNFESLGFSQADTINWNSSEEWLTLLQEPKAGAYIDWAWDMSSPSRLTRLELKSFDDTNTQLAGFLDCKFFADLEYLDCSNSQISTLNISENINLKFIDCSANKLTALITPQGKILSSLDCSNNELNELDLSHNFSLNSINCSNNKLSVLNLKDNSNLVNIACANNNIGNLFLPNSIVLESLDCSNNNISKLSLADYVNLKLLSIDNNQINDIDISKNENLVSVYTQKNELADIDLSSNNQLRLLNAAYNNLDNINISYTPQIQYFYGQGNLFNSLNLASNNNILELNCSNNELLALDLSNNPLLTDLDCSFNYIEQIQTPGTTSSLLSFIGNDNKLKFSTLPIDYFSSSTQKLIYSPQALIDLGEVLFGDIIDLSSEFKIQNTNTLYEWTREDNTPTTNINNEGDGLFKAFVNEDIVYYSKATNSIFPDLDLMFKVKTLKDINIGVVENDSEKLYFFNKPSQQIQINNPDLIKSVDMFDAMGRRILQVPHIIEKNISVEGLPIGVYLIKINLKSGKSISDKISI